VTPVTDILTFSAPLLCIGGLTGIVAPESAAAVLAVQTAVAGLEIAFAGVCAVFRSRDY